ncbi:nucleoside-diphosphate kinase [Streptomyces sp. NBC_00448]|uniref:nucleoside-diphosphate kinase n=1 Tax=Streptomyces sp. NBC_00448 TaxID=2903652 RepID=UPI002E1D0FF5
MKPLPTREARAAQQAADGVRAELAALVGTYPELADFHREIVEALPDACLPALRRTALAVVPPDGLMQGVHQRLLGEHGEHVVAFRFRTLTPRLAERVYHDGLVTEVPGRHIRSWWIKRKVFDLGEALVLLLRHPTDPSFQQTVTTAKGASDPQLAQPGSYRADYRTPNKTFGLLHSSDDLLSMLYEASVLFEPRELSRLLAGPHWGPAERAVVSGYEAATTVPRIESYRVLYRLKRRLLAETAMEGLLPPRVLEAADTLYRSAMNVVDADPGHGPETQAIARHLKQERDLLQDAAPPGGSVAQRSDECGRTTEPRTAFACLRMLAEPAAIDADGFTSLKSSLDALGIGLGPLERTVLESLFFFSGTGGPRPSATTPVHEPRRRAGMSTPYQQVLDAAESREDYPLSLSDVEELGRAGLTLAADQLAFMIITPDAVHRGKHADILAHVHDAGFRIRAHRTRNLRDSDIEELYKYGLRAKILDHQRTHWHLTRKGLSMGTSLGLLLQHPDGAACERLLRLKGASKPADAAPDSIRGGLRSYSKILALVHSSDDSAAALRECLLYFSPRQLLDVLPQYVTSPSPRGKHLSYVAEALSPTTAEDDPLTVLYALKTRISHAIASHPLAAAPAAQQLLREHLAELRTTRDRLRDGVASWRSQVRVVSRALEREHVLLTDDRLACCPESFPSVTGPKEDLERLAWHRLLLTARQLADQQCFEELDMNQVEAAVRAAHVHLTPWEALLVENLLFFWDL